MVALLVDADGESEVSRGRPGQQLTNRDAAAPPKGTRSRSSLWQEQRAALELAELLASPVYYGVGVPRGAGAPVLTFPGFLGSDDYLSVLRGWLRRVGYRPYGSGIALCAGPVRDLLARVRRRVEEVARLEGQPLTLIGHSLGGILSCAVARQRPELVAHVVTLGSALCDDPRGASHPLVVALSDLLGGAWSADHAWTREAELFGARRPAGVALTSIYSREDAVVDWQACIAADPRAAAYEVPGTHAGLAWNAAVYRHLGQVLLAVP